MKICFKCKEEKPLSDYYKHKAMADGHLNKCKTCTKRDTDKREKQSINASRSILVREEGILIFWRSVHPANDSFPM